MFKYLDQFTEKGQFIFSQAGSFSQVCNAPKHSSGIYLISVEEIQLKNLMYIGISGREGITRWTHFILMPSGLKIKISYPKPLI